MKITKIKLKNFRGYREEVEVELDDLTTFVGENDVGKSTILEALDIFLEGGIVKFDANDISVQSEGDEGAESQITLIFGKDLPKQILIDVDNLTTLQDECLLNKNGELEIIKRYGKKSKPSVFIRAFYPSHEKCRGLLGQKNSDLKKLVDEEGIACANKSKNAELRKAIMRHYDESGREEMEIELDKEDAKRVWGQIENHLPLFFLFQSDRAYNDKEVQDPMKMAIQAILGENEIASRLEEVAGYVRDKLEKMTENIRAELDDINPEINKTLNPVIPEAGELKWVDVFKQISITGDENIPVSKRGSGVKRMILLSFLKAEAKKKYEEQKGQDGRGVVYAIEEPETFQHQKYQDILIRALTELSKAERHQVCLTTHSPSVVKSVGFDGLRVIRLEGKRRVITKIDRDRLLYPSLNEANYLAFGMADEEYHNELYGYIEAQKWLGDYKSKCEADGYQKNYKNAKNNTDSTISLSEYIRHQIHHPENSLNQKYSAGELRRSIGMMRDFILAQNGAKS